MRRDSVETGEKKLLTGYALINDLRQASNYHTRATERTQTCRTKKQLTH